MEFAQDDPKLKRFCHHMVTILAESGRTESNGQPNFWHGDGSGFVVQVKEKHWLVTAGHVIDAVKEAHEAGHLGRLSLCDAWMNANGTGRPIPLPKESSQWIAIGKAEGLDCAVMDLGSLLWAGLEKGGIVAVPENHWKNPPADFDFYLLVGTPGEFITSNASKTGPATSFDIPRGVVSLQKIEKPQFLADTPCPRFYGHLTVNKEGRAVESIEGTSGGPIFGCKERGNDFDFWTIAIQSGWYPSKRVIVGDYLSIIADLILNI